MVERLGPQGQPSKRKLETEIVKSLAEASAILEILEARQELDLKARHVLSRLLDLHGVSPAASGEPLLPADDESIILLRQKIEEVNKILRSLEEGKTIAQLSDEQKAVLAQFTGNPNFRAQEEDKPEEGSFADVLEKKMEE